MHVPNSNNFLFCSRRALTARPPTLSHCALAKVDYLGLQMTKLTF